MTIYKCSPPSNLVYGYGAGEFNPHERSPIRPFRCRFSRATRESGTFREECVNVARSLGALDKPIAILLSGGLDSEIVVRAFQEAEVPFQCFTLRIENYTEHEMEFMEGVCKKLGITSNIYDIEKTWLYGDQCKEFFENSNAYFIEMTPQMKLMKHLADQGFLPVLGNGEVLLEKHKGVWKYTEFEYDLAWYRFAAYYGFDAVPGFFQQSAEIQLAALNHPRTQAVLQGTDVLANKMLMSTRPVKYAMYKDEWPNIRTRQKFDGFEQLRSVGFVRSAKLRGPMNHFNARALLSVPELRGQLESCSKPIQTFCDANQAE